MDFSAFGQVVAIDLVLAGDNAIVVGALAASLSSRQRRTAVCVGMLGAVVARILLSVAAAWLVQIPGLGLIGGVLLFWVAWKMWSDLQGSDDTDGVSLGTRSMWGAIGAITLADLSMSLDNVLGVSGAAQGHFGALVFGLMLSIFLMAVAASFIASILNRHRWLGYVGLAFVAFVAARMVWSGALIFIHR